MSNGPRVLRSLREMKLMRKAGLVVWKAHQEMAKLVKPGTRTIEIESVARQVFEQYEAEPLFLGVEAGPGIPPFPAVTCISVNEKVVHGIPVIASWRLGMS